MPLNPDLGLDEAIILCGGLGTRLKSVIADRPKALVEVRGRRFLEWLILSLARRDSIRHVVLATGYLGEMIERHFGGSHWCGVRISYSREPHPLGTAGALRLAAGHTTSSRLLVTNGDTYCPFDPRRLVDLHVGRSAMATLWLVETQNASRFGTVALDVDGQITGFNEKASVRGPLLASAGVYLIERKEIVRIEKDRPASLERDFFPSLIGKGLYGIEGKGGFIDVGTPESLASADAALAQELEGLNCG